MRLKIWHASGSSSQKISGGLIMKIPMTRLEVTRALAAGKPLSFTHDHGFRVSNYTIILNRDIIELKESVRYTDDSGRNSREGSIYFVKGSYELALKEPSKMKESGWLGQWRNIDKSGGIASNIGVHFYN